MIMENFYHYFGLSFTWGCIVFAVLLALLNIFTKRDKPNHHGSSAENGFDLGTSMDQES